MKKTSFIFLIYVMAALSAGCNNSDDNKPADDRAAGDAAAQKPVFVDSLLLKECLHKESYIASLQGVPESTAGRGPYGILSCNRGPGGFDLVFSLRDTAAIDSLSAIFSDESKTGFKSFDVFKFESPSKREDEADYHDDPAIYPSVMKAYKRENGKWTFLGEKQVKDRGEISLFMISQIKKEDK